MVLFGEVMVVRLKFVVMKDSNWCWYLAGGDNFCRPRHSHHSWIRCGRHILIIPFREL
jgi:hypothetical protein